MDNKEAAKQLYLDGWEQSRIATALGIAQKTISSWKKNNDWDKERIQMSVIAQESAQRVWALIDYQTKALDQQRKRFEDAAQEEGTPLALIDKGHLDALQKLFSIVKAKETKFLDVIKIAMSLLDFIQSKDLKLAKASHEYFTKFIEENRTKYE